MAASLPSIQPLGLSAKAIFLANGWWETNLILQVTAIANHLDWQCRPKFRPPATLDNFVGGDVAKSIVNPAIASTTVAAYAQEVKLIKILPNGSVRRMEGMPDGRGNAVFELALKNRDKKALKQFSLGGWQSFLGCCERLSDKDSSSLARPEELRNMDTLETWYRQASESEDVSTFLGLKVLGKALSKLNPKNGIYDDKAVISALKWQAGNAKGAAKRWDKIKSTAYSYYNKLK